MQYQLKNIQLNIKNKIDYFEKVCAILQTQIKFNEFHSQSEVVEFFKKGEQTLRKQIEFYKSCLEKNPDFPILEQEEFFEFMKPEGNCKNFLSKPALEDSESEKFFNQYLTFLFEKRKDDFDKIFPVKDEKKIKEDIFYINKFFDFMIDCFNYNKDKDIYYNKLSNYHKDRLKLFFWQNSLGKYSSIFLFCLKTFIPIQKETENIVDTEITKKPMEEIDKTKLTKIFLPNKKNAFERKIIAKSKAEGFLVKDYCDYRDQLLWFFANHETINNSINDFLRSLNENKKNNDDLIFSKTNEIINDYLQCKERNDVIKIFNKEIENCITINQNFLDCYYNSLKS